MDPKLCELALLVGATLSWHSALTTERGNQVLQTSCLDYAKSTAISGLWWLNPQLLLLLLGLGPVFSINKAQSEKLLIVICRKTPNTPRNSAEGDPSAIAQLPMAQLDPDPPQHGHPCSGGAGR